MRAVEIPQSRLSRVTWPKLCVACGTRLSDDPENPFLEVGTWYAKGTGQAKLDLRFPICGECEAKRQRAPDNRGILGCSIGAVFLVLALLLASRSLVTASIVAVAGVMIGIAVLVLENRERRQRYPPEILEQADNVNNAVNVFGSNAEAARFMFLNGTYLRAFREMNQGIIKKNR